MTLDELYQVYLDAWLIFSHADESTKEKAWQEYVAKRDAYLKVYRKEIVKFHKRVIKEVGPLH